MTYLIMWVMEGLGVHVLVISLDQPVLIGTGTDGLVGPIQSNSPVCYK